MPEISENNVETRKVYFALVTVFLFIIIAYRFFSVQVFGWEEYLLRSEENRIRSVVDYPIRGLIYDENGKLIVDNVPAYSVYVVPYELKDREFFYSFLRENFSDDDITAIERKIQSATPYQPTKIMQVDYNRLTMFEENISDLPGVMTRIEPQRDYPSGVSLAHFLGYIKEIDEEEITNAEDDYYRSGDIIGKAGLERQYENELRGVKGLKFLEVNALGQVIDEVKSENTKEPIHGNHLILTLDLEVQALAEELLDTLNGAVVAIDPRSGEFYAAASKPDYDPYLFGGIITPDVMNALNNDPNKPQYIRATQGEYPPGSTFKLIGAIAALNDNILTPEQKYTCTGSHLVGNKLKYCWLKTGHGTVNMYQAIEQSCNVYFYNLSRELDKDKTYFGIDRWAKYGAMFEFGQRTGLDFPVWQENPGTLPTSEYMNRTLGESPQNWTTLGAIVNLIIGQGELLATPLQIVRFTGAIGTKGLMVQPHFLKNIIGAHTDSIIYTPTYKTSQIENIRDDVWDVVREGMRLVINGESGTARSVKRRVGIPDLVIAGKTGTSQNPHGDDHAWFIGFAPFDNPSIAITVVVENGGGGSRVAAPIASQIIKKHFEILKRKEKLTSLTKR